MKKDYCKNKILTMYYTPRRAYYTCMEHVNASLQLKAIMNFSLYCQFVLCLCALFRR